METPDKWVVVKIENAGSILYKVFASWYGGYLGSDSWKINSGIVSVDEDENCFKFYGHSGSCYRCYKNTYGTSMYSQGVLNDMIELAKKQNAFIEVLSEDTDWLNLTK
jgi:hypothetical protein